MVRDGDRVMAAWGDHERREQEDRRREDRRTEERRREDRRTEHRDVTIRVVIDKHDLREALVRAVNEAQVAPEIAWGIVTRWDELEALHG